MIIEFRQQLEKVSVAELSVGDISVASANIARNLGVKFDLNLKFDTQITKTCSTGYLTIYTSQYKKVQDKILNDGFIKVFGSCPGYEARRLL